MQQNGNEQEQGDTSLLDRLKKQAAQARAREQEAAAQDAFGEAFYEAELQPRMVKAVKYFESIVADLNTIGSHTNALFPIGPAADRDVPFLQHDYTLFTDDQSHPREIAVNCVCELTMPVVRHVTNTREGDEFEAYLREMGIQFHRRRQLETAIEDQEDSRFTMEGAVNAGFKITVDLAKQRIEVVTRNLEQEPRRSYFFAAERLEEPLFEALGNLLLRERTDLVKNDVSAEVRKKLRIEHEREEMERARLLAIAEEEHKAERMRRLDRRILRRLAAGFATLGKETRAFLQSLRKQ